MPSGRRVHSGSRRLTPERLSLIRNSVGSLVRALVLSDSFLFARVHSGARPGVVGFILVLVSARWPAYGS